MPRVPGAQRISRFWLNLSLTAKGGAVVAIPVICTISMLALLADLQRRFETAMQAVVHTEQVLSQSRDIAAAALTAESTARGYLLTGDSAFLETHRVFRRQLSNGFSQILVLTDDNPAQQERIRHAMGLINDELDALDRQFRLTGSELNAAVSASRRRVALFGSEIVNFEAGERQLLAERQSATLQHRDRLRRGLWGFCVVGALSSIFGTFLFTAGFKRRLTRVADNAARFARRESDRPVDGGRDTIGRLEESLVAATRALLDREQRLSENAAELERAKLAAEAAVQAKTEFCAAMSHEVRSSINTMLGAAEMMGAAGLSPRQVEYARVVERAGNGLLSVIDEAIDHARVDSPGRDLEKVHFDLAGLLDRIIDLMSAGASGKGLELLSPKMPGVPRCVVGDPDRLQRVLIALVSNAIKFSDVGFVAIRVESADVPGLLHFTVADTGAGIARERHEAIFEDGAGGEGLGLATSRRIVETMGGRLWVDSDEGEGATFHFTAVLPAASDPGAPPVEAAPPRRIAARALLAGGSAAGIARIRDCLAGAGCSVEVAADGETALARLREGSYNLALIGVDTPKLGGHDVMRLFREWERADSRPRTPLIALAASASEQDLELAIKAGADAQLTEPIRCESLLAAAEFCQRPDDMPDVRVAVPEFLRELAPEFLRRQRSGLLAVAAARQAGNFEAIRSFAHNMKGCGKSFGFPRLTEMGREMECAAKDCDPDLLGRQIAELREYLTEVDVA